MHILHLSADVLQNVAALVHSARDGVQLRCTCRLLWDVLDDVFFQRRCYETYGTEFWSKALARPTRLSRPLKSWFAEWQRIKRFQEVSKLVDGYRVPNALFFHMWSQLEKTRRFAEDPADQFSLL